MFQVLIDAWGALPRASESHLQERIWFDLKATYSPKSQPEMAKDIAAFANALGGAIILGAKEGPIEPDYSSPLRSEYATKIEGELDEAVRDFCRPSPAVHVRTIPVPTVADKVIVVVNVEPFVDQPVAARHESDTNAWRFPRRVGRHTEYLLPEQLPLHMNSKARRAKLLLLRALFAGGEIDLFTVPSGLFRRGDIQGPGQFTVESVDREGGGAFLIRDCVGDLGGQAVTIPIDDVEAIWLQQTGRWAVRLSGRLEEFTGSGDGVANELAYVPPSTFVVSPLGSVMERMSDRIHNIGQKLSGALVVQHHARPEPSEASIAERAHQLWLLRNTHSLPGTAENDWLRARQQLLARSND